ncbi:4'-phosphopantetheinyl transferase family protein [Streptomyces justiciae]|uniref:4'-phosphopantetheinyl transferase family protein n=1 Tax=Streptomyces justiciae TaxID=2780140 RepID=UPI0021173B65|nr:4'-phosphopantetheinyl transferase superfamily protein [Streptomyces justiciae]MCW8383168.1 4'-phosphopantetheinyl transferase superfamily protein [Streptomyces justiciae]
MNTPPRPPSPLVLAYDLHTPGAEAAARAVLPRLSADDRERVARLRRPDDRTRSVLARWLALQGAARLLDTPWTGLRLTRDPRGRPYVVGRPRLSLSLAHSGRYAMAAVAHGGRVGVDVEAISRVAALPDSAYLTPAEISALPPAPHGIESRAALWALKEAATKLTGEGLRAGMRHVGFRRREGMRGPIVAQTPYTPGVFTAHRLPGGYVCAVGLDMGPQTEETEETERSAYVMHLTRPIQEHRTPNPGGAPAEDDDPVVPGRPEQDEEETEPHIWLSVN